MINNNLPQVKTVKLLFVAVDEQQQAMFNMAFKMHNTTNYQVVDAASGEKPELVIVDGDTSAGVTAWHKAKGVYEGSMVVFFSKSPPPVTAPYLSKPIKFNTLFLSLRNLMQGNGVWVVNSSSSSAHLSTTPAARTAGTATHSPVSHHRASEITIPRFDPNVGLLGAFREVLTQQRNAAILIDDKLVLAVFSNIQQVWVAVDSEQLKAYCRQGHVNVKIKQIPDDSNVQERVNATVTSCMWQVGLWTANGRLVQPIKPNKVFKLKILPNFTRFGPVAGWIRVCGLINKNAGSLNMLYKLMPLEMADILNYIAATYLTDYLEITQQVKEDTASGHSATQATVSTHTHAAQRSEQEQAAQPQQAQKSGGLLGRLMKKLLNK